MFTALLRNGIELRVLREQDVPKLFARVERDREHLRKWLAWVDATKTEEDTRAFVRATLEQATHNFGFVAGVWRNDDVIGTVGMHRIDWMNQRVELGYWLGREFQGQGIITDACRTIISHCFKELDLHRVEIRCAVGNTKSAAIPKALGFQREAILREAQYSDGAFHDVEVFGMLRHEWRS